MQRFFPVFLFALCALSPAAFASTPLACEGIFAQAAPATGPYTAGSLPTSFTLSGLAARLTRWALARRYEVEVTGLREVAAKGTQKTLFLFEHPALIDPVIFYSETGEAFRPRPLIAESQVTSLRDVLFRRFRRMIVPKTVSDPAFAGLAAQAIANLNSEILAELASGGNIAMAPAGTLKRARYEDLRQQSMAASAIQSLPPGARVVLVTSKGLWGSSFGWGHSGRAPVGPEFNGDLLIGLLTNSLARREVKIGFEEIPPEVLAELRDQDRAGINDYLRSRFNRVLQDNVFVPLRGCRPACVLPDPVAERARTEAEIAAEKAAAAAVPPDLRARVVAGLVSLYPADRPAIERAFAGDDRAATGAAANVSDLLGLDSLAYVEAMLRLGQLLGKDLGQLEDGPPDAFLISVYRAMLGEAKSAADKLPIDVRYFRYSDSSSPLEIPAGGNILSVLFRKASENPDAAWMADENSGVVTYRQGIGKILVLARAVRKMRGERIGLMLPPSVGGVLFFFATLQAGKTPVEVNYTAGNENLLHSMNLVEAQTVVTSRQFVGKLGEKNYGIDAIQDRFLYTEDLAQSIQERSIANAWNLFMNGLAINRARFKALWPRGWLRRSRAPAVILSTSGSSGLPKAVELSDANLLSNVRAITPLFGRAKSDSMTSFAPFFHSLGVTGTIVLPALSGLRVNYVANATDGPGIALAIASYSSTMMIGPPSLLQQIFASASADFFAPLRLIVTGAEKLLPSTAAFLAAKAPGAKILEGAGTTEASPVWAVTAPDDIRPGFVGKILPTISYLIVDHDSLDLAVEAGDPSRARLAEPAADGSLDGELLLSGDSVIERYYAGAKPEAFVVLGGRRYFRTGDRVVAMPDRFAKILGRFTRQHKAPGGEMINHEMAEAAISDVPQLKPGADGKQSFFVGVAALPEGELATALLTTRDVGLGDVNPSIVRQLSATWAIKKIFRVAEIPLLGTGKTNQRACQEMIDAKARAEAP